MKFLIILSLFTMLLLNSCKKDKNTQTSSTGVFSLQGTWLIIEQTGGIAGIHQIFARGSGNISYTFRPDSTCTRTSSSFTENTTYSIRPDTTVTGTYDLQIPNAILLRMSNAHDTLLLEESGISDGFSYRFVK